jgi:uncharacterized membrane protein
VSKGSGLRALLVVAGLLPWAAPWLPRAARVALGLALAPICHQRPERTLVFAGHAMSVCSRCAGLYMGVALGALLAWPLLSERRWRKALAIAAGAMAIDVLSQDLGLHPVWHGARLATGALAGYVASAWLAQSVLAQRS